MNDPGLLGALIEALGWTLLHFVWQGLVIGVVFACTMFTLRSASSNARYWCGMLALAAMLAAPLITMSTQLETATAAQAGSFARVTTSAGTVPAPDLLTVLEERVEAILPWAVLAWFVGVMVLSGRLALDFVRIRRLAMVDVKPLSPALQRAVDRLVESLRIRSAVRVLESARVAVPMVVGWLRPVVLLPPSVLMGLTPRQLELIISHELAHVKRLDYLFNLLQIMVETLLFYHPAVRMVSIRVRMERENCCDDIVVARTGETLAYARALTEVEGLRCSSGMQLSLAATGGHLRGRVTRLVAAPAPQRGAVHWVAGLVLLASGFGAVSGARVVLQEGPAPEPVRPVDSTPSLPPEPVAASVAPSSPKRSPAVVLGAGQTEIAAETSVAGPTVAPAPKVEIRQPAKTPRTPKAIEPNVQIAMAKTPLAAPAQLPVEPMIPEPPTGPRHEETPTEAPVVPQPPATPAPTARATPADENEMRPAADQPVEPAAPIEPAAPEITGGELIKSPAPAYPRRARLNGQRGFVTVRYAVTAKGRVKDIEIVESTASIFEKPVKRSLRRWRYEPFLADGKPVKLTLEHTFRFDLAAEALAQDHRNGRCEKITGSRLCRPSTGYDDLGVVVVYNDPLIPEI